MKNFKFSLEIIAVLNFLDFHEKFKLFLRLRLTQKCKLKQKTYFYVNILPELFKSMGVMFNDDIEKCVKNS